MGVSSNLDSTLTSCSRLCSSRHINLHCLISFYPRALSFFPHLRHSGLLLSPMSVSVFFFTDDLWVFQFLSTSTHLYDWYPPSLLWLILWLIWRLGLSACWSHRGTRARVLGLPPPFRPLALVLGFLSAPRTLNGVAMVDRPHYHPHGFRFSVFAISIPQLRAHAGAVAGSRLVRRDLYSFCFSSVPPTAARPGSAPQATCYSAVLRIRATIKAHLRL